MASLRLSVAPAPALVRLIAAAGVALAILLGASNASQAQPAEPPTRPHRPKVALVLSGGGAMGIAHVGAIQELERLGIRPDLLVGTSMGSIVGGLYASGLSGAELQRAVETMDWDAIFDTSPPRAGLSYRQKSQQADFPVKASIGVANGRLQAPEGLISDANLLLQLRRLLNVRGAVPSFDDLPIPFRAVATDIETGQKVVIDRGELAGAMRASMSVPGVFAPYRLDGRLLVDGGMADNVPIDVARDLGADIVIVVATQTPMAKGEALRGVPAILGQTVTMLILANERQQLATLKPSDVLINVEMNGLGAADFKKAAALMDAGHKAAAKREAQLQRVAALRGPSPSVAASRPPPVVGYVRVENDSRISNTILLRKIEPFVGKPMDAAAVVAALQDIYALGVFTRVDFTVEEKDGKTGLVVHAQQRPGDENRLRPGLTIAAAGKGRSSFDISADFRLMQLDSYGSEARFVGVLGDHKRFEAEYFKVLDSRQRWFVQPSIDLQRRPVAVYDAKGFRLGEYDAGYGLISLAGGRLFGNSGEMRLGVQSGIGSATVQEGRLTPAKVDLDIGQLYGSAAFDTLDNPYFPNRGGKGVLQWTQGLKGLGDVADYQKVSATGYQAFGWGRNALIVGLDGGDAYQGRLPLSSLFTLGGPFSFPGFSTEELSGETYLVARAMYRRRLTNHSESLFGLPIYAGATLVAGNIWARHGDADWGDLRVGVNAFIAADTLIGPVFLAAGAADGGHNAIYVFLGRPF
ncbi:MAG: patatin-like phospholipase family protein [Phenylobacterium sp.]